MRESLCWLALFLLVTGGLFSCAEDEGKATLVGPGLETGPGRIYPLREVSFPTADGIQVSGLFGPTNLSSRRPVVLLLHNLDGNKETWLTRTSLFVELLERGYMVVAVDLRGFGQTPLPEGRQVPLISDLEVSFRDVQAALVWLSGQPGADLSRVGLIGIGSGGNIAYVSMGVFPGQLKTAVSLSPGLWERTTLQPVVVGAGLESFRPRSILFMVGAEDVLSSGGITLSYADFARALAATTAEPKSVLIFPGSADHGLALLNNNPEARQALFLWLEKNL